MNKSIEIYKYLVDNCAGYANKIKGKTLMRLFEINDHKTLRSHIEELRQSNDYKYLVGSEAGKNGGYWIVTSEKERQLTIDHLYLRANEQLNTCSKMREKAIYEIINLPKVANEM